MTVATELMHLKRFSGDVAELLLRLVNGNEDIETVAGALFVCLGPERTTEVMGRHGINMTFRPPTDCG